MPFLGRSNVLLFALQTRQEIEKERMDPFFPPDTQAQIEHCQGVLAAADTDEDVWRVGKDSSQDGE